MKKIILTATALIFTVAMFANTGSAPVKAKTTPKHKVAQTATKPAEAKTDTKATEGKKGGEKKVKHHKKGTSPKK